MNKFRREVLWTALLVIALLTGLSIYGAFIGAERAQEFFNRVPLAVYWIAFAILLIVALNVFPRLIRVPGLMMMHVGCVLILAGGMLGSKLGNDLQRRLFGIDRIRSGRMKIYEDQTTNKVELESRIPLFSVEPEFASSLDRGVIPQKLRQEFEKRQIALSQDAAAWVSEAGRMWWVADESKQYLVRVEKGRPKVYERIMEAKALPFSIRLKNFRIEYYQPANLYIETRQGERQKVPAEIGKEFALGEGLGTAKVVRAFENFKIGMEEGKSVPYDDPQPGSNPALEVQVTQPDGRVTTKYVFENFPGHSHGQESFLMNYRRTISDYISEIQLIQDGRVVAAKDVEVNHPLHYGGYHFYQADYDHQASRYTVFSVHSDAGLYIVYAGYWLLCLGVIWHLWLRHVSVARLSSLVSRRAGNESRVTGHQSQLDERKTQIENRK